MIDWLNDWLNDWLVEWLIEWLIDWLIDWFFFLFGIIQSIGAGVDAGLSKAVPVVENGALRRPPGECTHDNVKFHPYLKQETLVYTHRKAG